MSVPSRRLSFTSIILYLQQHPWRAAEHFLLIGVIFLYFVRDRDAVCSKHLSKYNTLLNCKSKDLCCCSSKKTGPASIFELDGVSKAPDPTMKVDDLKPGQVVEHHDFRGDIYRFPMGDGIILNLMHTVPGTMRSGDLHNCTQYDVVLKGKTRLRTLEVDTGLETVRDYDANDFIEIPARVPHLFEFLEDNYMVEWWNCTFAAWYYKPYRDRISEQFQQAKDSDG